MFDDFTFCHYCSRDFLASDALVTFPGAAGPVHRSCGIERLDACRRVAHITLNSAKVRADARRNAKLWEQALAQ